VEVGIQEVLKTWDCKTPDCDGTAYKRSGPYAMLCRLCTEEAREKARRARHDGAAPACPSPMVREAAKPALSFERRAASLVEVGHWLDEAWAAYQPARAALEEATQAWREAVAQLPGSAVNGEIDAVAANRLLTNGLAQAVTTGDPAGA
jgi:hypothetical protein